MSGDETERKEGSRVCEAVFGDDWKQCVSPQGRKTLKQRVDDGKVYIEIRSTDAETRQEDDS